MAGVRRRKGNTMLSETLSLGYAIEARKTRSKATADKRGPRHKGVFEKVPGSGVWWIRYADTTSRIRREKAGSKSNAIILYQKRKGEILTGKKLPEKLRARKVLFSRTG